MKILLPVLFLLCGSVSAQVEPDAGSWKTWVLTSGSQFRQPPPPKATATQTELTTLLNAQTRRDAKAMQQITYWNAGAPGYRWLQLVDSLIAGTGANAPIRAMTLLNVAIYDATIAAWDTKYAYQRARPATTSTALKPAIATPDSPSYPCEHAVIAGVAATLLSYLVPAKADSLRQLAEQAMQSRVLAGVAYPSDVKAGFELGRQVAGQFIARGATDGWGKAWTGKMPGQAGRWRGKVPVGADRLTVKPWVLDSLSQFRPGPPPDFTKDMAELKAFTQTTDSRVRAWFYGNIDFWTDIVHQKVFEYHLDQNPPRAARVYALTTLARHEAVLACFDAKYTYWGIRPEQFDTTFVPLLMQSPPFPGYPSGHAAFSSSVATTLAYLFPAEAAYFRQKADESAQARFEAGVHFRTDNEVGKTLGRQVGGAVINRARQDGADRNQGLVRK